MKPARSAERGSRVEVSAVYSVGGLRFSRRVVRIMFVAAVVARGGGGSDESEEAVRVRRIRVLEGSRVQGLRRAI